MKYSFLPLWIYGKILKHLAVLNMCQEERDELGGEILALKHRAQLPNEVPSPSQRVGRKN